MKTVSNELAPGRLFGGRFRLLAPLDEGGAGRVWHAVDETTGGQVAIRFDSERPGPDPATTVAHPHVVCAYVFDSQEEAEYSVTELVDGVSLATILDEGPVPEDDAWRITVELCQALHAAHRVGVTHGDLKPSNVLIADEGFVKVVGFTGDGGWRQDMNSVGLLMEAMSDHRDKIVSRLLSADPYTPAELHEILTGSTLDDQDEDDSVIGAGLDVESGDVASGDVASGDVASGDVASGDVASGDGEGDDGDLDADDDDGSGGGGDYGDGDYGDGDDDDNDNDNDNDDYGFSNGGYGNGGYGNGAGGGDESPERRRLVRPAVIASTVTLAVIAAGIWFLVPTVPANFQSDGSSNGLPSSLAGQPDQSSVTLVTTSKLPAPPGAGNGGHPTDGGNTVDTGNRGNSGNSGNDGDGGNGGNGGNSGSPSSPEVVPTTPAVNAVKAVVAQQLSAGQVQADAAAVLNSKLDDIARFQVNGQTKQAGDRVDMLKSQLVSLHRVNKVTDTGYDAILAALDTL